MLRTSPLPLAFAAFVAAGLLLERTAGSTGELALGVLTWLLRDIAVAAGRECRAPDVVEVLPDHGATLRQALGAVIDRKAESSPLRRPGRATRTRTRSAGRAAAPTWA